MSSDIAKKIAEAAITPRKEFISRCRHEVNQFLQDHKRAWIMKIRDDRTSPVNKDEAENLKKFGDCKRGKGRPIGFAVVFIDESAVGTLIYAGASIASPRETFNNWIGQAYAIRNLVAIPLNLATTSEDAKALIDQVVANFSRREYKCGDTTLYFGNREFAKIALRRMVASIVTHYRNTRPISVPTKS